MTDKEKQIVTAKEKGWTYIGSNLYKKQGPDGPIHKLFKDIK